MSHGGGSGPIRRMQRRDRWASLVIVVGTVVLVIVAGWLLAGVLR